MRQLFLPACVCLITWSGAIGSDPKLSLENFTSAPAALKKAFAHAPAVETTGSATEEVREPEPAAEPVVLEIPQVLDSALADLAIEYPVPSGDTNAAAQPESVPLPPVARQVVTRSSEEICDTLTKAAHSNDLPVPFFIRLLFQESRFDAGIVSPAGAQGIAQFMPETAADVGLDNPFDPLQAIPASARLLRSLLTQFGNLGLAAAAYNAGPKRIQEWLQKRRKTKLPQETQASAERAKKPPGRNAMKSVKAALALAFTLVTFAATAADYPAPKQGEWIARDFKFHTGETMAELRLHYTTVGNPSGQPVLVLHGTGGSANSMLTANFAGELFGAGAPLDATKYFIILPDALGAGKSSKPSDGLKAKFPKYNYDDMVEAQYRLLKEGLGIKHLRLVIGNSMGGMHTWLWVGKYPDFMDAAVPMAAQPTAMASRNWMLRRMMIEAIKADPEYNNGNYTAQPRMLKIANVFFAIATNGGTLNYQNVAPTFAQADELVTKRLAAEMKADANDFLYQWDSSRGFDAAPQLEKIQASLLAINAADDERNPPESGIMEREMKRVKSGRLYVIPASKDTRGHGTTGMAKFYKTQLEELLKTAPQKAM